MRPVAVGTAVTRCPPHRPVLAELPHTVPTLDLTPRPNSICNVPRSTIVHLRYLAQCPAQARAWGSPWPAPFPPHPPPPTFRSGFVRTLRRYYGAARLLAGVHDRITLMAFRSDPALFRWMPARSPGSRACSFSTCVWLCDYAGPERDSRFRFPQYGLPVGSTRSAPEWCFSKLNSSPADASVYTSPGTSRHPAQDSRSRWFATPFL